MSIGNHNTKVPIPGTQLGTRWGGSNPGILVPGEHPTETKGPIFIAALAFAQMGLFIALLGPVMVSMALKVTTLTDDPTTRTTMVGLILSFGAIPAVIGNALFGRLSDRTTSRFGRRRPWLIGGVLVMAAALLLIAVATTTWMLALGWFIAQLGANAAFSPYIATLADQLPERQYGKVSAIVGIMQNVGILGGTWFASLFTNNMFLLFMVPAAVGVIGMVIYAVVLPDPVRTDRPPKLDFKEIAGSFWTSPVKYPDFAMVWWSRFFFILAGFLFTTFRFTFVIDRLQISEAEAAAVVFKGVLVYTLALVISGYIVGALTDRTGKRKVPAILAAAMFAVGTYMLAHVGTVGQFYLVEIFIGLGYGVYYAVDMALVLSVLPDPKTAAKDLGVFNMANAGPQSLAPAMGAILLTIQATNGPNYNLLLGAAAAVALAGALVLIPVKKAK